MSEPITFTPEPRTSSVPPSQRGRIDIESIAGRPGRWRVRAVPDGHPGAAPGWPLLTSADLRRLATVLRLGHEPQVGFRAFAVHLPSVLQP
jgi:hypothetical protein